MSCVSPYFISVRGEKQQVDCGRCMQCRIKKQTALKFLANKELLNTYKRGQGASFVTLTYDDNNIPFIHLPTGNVYRGLHNLMTTRQEVYYTLFRKDVSNFIKKVRRNMDYHGNKVPFKVIYCGEFGGQTDRPHYHIIFLGLTDFQAKMYTRKCWTFGLCDVGPLAQGGVNYVTKYLLKNQSYDKRIKALYSHCRVQGPFLYHSVGLGKDWIKKNYNKIADNNYLYLDKGKAKLVPSYIRDYTKYRTGIDCSQSVNDYFNKNIIPKWKKVYWDNLKSFDAWDKENSYVREKQLIDSAKSRGLNVNPEFIAKKSWCKPIHSYDRPLQRQNKWYNDYKSHWYSELKLKGWNNEKIMNFFRNIS